MGGPGPGAGHPGPKQASRDGQGLGAAEPHDPDAGLPGLAGFPAEFQVVRGAWPVFTLITALSMIGLLMTGAYVLKAIQKVLHGPKNEELLHHAQMTDIDRREVIALAPLLVLMLVIGVYPFWLMEPINQAVMRLVGG